MFENLNVINHLIAVLSKEQNSCDYMFQMKKRKCV